MASIAESKAETKLMDEFQKLLVAHRVAFGQERCFRRFVALTIAMVFCFGRRTITQMLLTLGLTDTDHSAMYRLFSRKRFKEEVLWRCLFAETLQHVGEDALYVVGTDATQIPRSGWHIAGVGWLKSAKSPAFKPGIHAAQRFVHGCWLTPMVNGFSRAIPLRFVPAFTEKAKRGDEEPCKEWEAGLKYVRWVRKEMDAVRPGQRILWLADGGYDNVELWKAMPAQTIGAMRTAKNRALFAYLPELERRGNRKYGEKKPSPAEYMKQWRDGTHKADIKVRGVVRSLRYRVEGPVVRRGAPDVPLFLIVVSGQEYKKGKRSKDRRPTAYLVSAQWKEGKWALPVEPELLLAWLWQRWEMEVAHREMKSSLGVGEQQCWNPRSAKVTVQWSAWVYAILVLSGYRAWQLSPGPAPAAKWSPRPRRWSFNTLWRTFRHELWLTPDYRPLWTPTRGNWLDTEAKISLLWNAVTGAVRA